MPTPRANVLRTLLQVVVAVLVVFPIALAKVPIPSKYQGSVALVLGIAAGVLVLVTTIQNVIEAKVGVALFRNTEPVPPPRPPGPPGGGAGGLP